MKKLTTIAIASFLFFALFINIGCYAEVGFSSWKVDLEDKRERNSIKRMGDLRSGAIFQEDAKPKPSLSYSSK